MPLTQSTQVLIQGTSGEDDKPFNYNSYATKKTVTKGLLNVGLLTSNSSQLKTLLEKGSSHKFYSISLTLIITSIVLQAFVGVMLLVMGCNKGEVAKDKKRVDMLNNITVGVVAVITGINIFITGFITQ